MIPSVVPTFHRCTEDPAARLRTGPRLDRPQLDADLAAHRRAIVSAVSMWTYLQGRMEPHFTLRRTAAIADGTAASVNAVDIEYEHAATRACGTLALRSLSFFPATPLLATAGLGSHAARRLHERATSGEPAGVLLRVGIDQWYYWRAQTLESWPHDVRLRLVEDAIACANFRWERGPLDMERLTQCLITHDGFSY